MKLALFNGLPFHYEMFAHILDYCKEKGHTVDCYTNTANNLGWLTIYLKTYAIRLFNLNTFDPSYYDHVFVITDDDRFYEPFWKNTKNAIIFEHCGTRKLHDVSSAKSVLQTRQFKMRNPPSNPDTWCIPLWNSVEFTHTPKKFDKLSVLCVGESSPRDPVDLLKLF